MGPLDMGGGIVLESSMLFLETADFCEVESTVLRAIKEHRETAAHWRAKYLEEAYEVFDRVAEDHELAARRLEAGWKIICEKFSQ